MSLLWVCFWQTVAIGWGFGAQKFCDCIEQMTGHQPGKYWFFCWKYIAPTVMAVSIISVSSHLTYSESVKRDPRV